MSSITLAPGAMPVLGHAPRMLRDPKKFMATLPAHGDLVRIKLGPISAVVVNDHELIREVLRDDRLFDKGGAMMDQVREVIGNGLGACPHADHRRQRALVQPAFHRGRFPAYARIMAEEVAAVTSDWHDGQHLDVAAEMMTTATRIVVRAMFSGAVTGAELDATVDDVKSLLDGIIMRAVVPRPLHRLVPPIRRSRRASARLRQRITGIIAHRRATGIDHGDLLSALLAGNTTADPVEESTVDELSETEVVDQMLTFFLAGAETTASTLSWAFHLLAEHPEVERRVQAEIDAVLAGAEPGLAHVARLELTGRVVAETLRLYPAAWLIPRITTEDVTLAGHAIPVGTSVFISPYALHHREDLHEDAERFDPDRWVSTPAVRGSYLPFGGGAHKCVGDQFSLTESVLALAVICGRWRMESLAAHPVRPGKLDTMEPRLTMRLAARTRTTAEV